MRNTHIRLSSIVVPLLGAMLLHGCTSESSGPQYQLDVPDHFPQPRLSQTNPLSAARVELGRFLFYDRNMSFNQTQSCGDCHQQDKAFTDGLTTSVGSEGGIHPRNAMGMANVIYNGTQNWVNPVITDLEAQALAVLLNEDPVELGWTNREDEIIDRFRVPRTGTAAGDIDYPALFREAFPGETDPFTIESFIRALGAFGATMISGNSEYDKVLRGEPDTMSDAARRGQELFFSERLECFHCHGGFHFSDNVDFESLQFTQHTFHNTALYDLDGNGRFPDENPGLVEFTLNPLDEGRFRPVTLRNIELTAPYMHDGSIATLAEVIDHYAAGGRASGNPLKSGFMVGFTLTANEELDLIEFLRSLTDWDFVCNENLSDPFGNIPMHPACP